MKRRILPYLILIIVMAPSAVWVALDRSVWPWDQAWYGEVSVDLYGALGQGLDVWTEAMRNALPLKPPGIAWLGQWFVPIGLALGRIEIALMASILLCQLGTLALVYRTGRLLAPDRPLIAIVGSLMIGSAPLFVGISHNYVAEPLQTFSVAWVFYIASLPAIRTCSMTCSALCPNQAAAHAANTRLKASAPQSTITAPKARRASGRRERSIQTMPSKPASRQYSGVVVLASIPSAATAISSASNRNRLAQGPRDAM